MNQRQFFFGTLRYLPLLERVLGRPVAAEPAVLGGWRAVMAQGENFPILVPDHHGRADGIVLTDISPDDRARLDHYEAAFGYRLHELTVTGGKAMVYLTETGRWQAGAPFDLTDWIAAHGAVTLEAARDYMAAFPTIQAETVAANWPMILQRADSRLRAAATALDDRWRSGAGRIAPQATEMPWLGYFGVSTARLTFQRFDGSQSAPVQRAGFLMGDAVTVLPYDPVRDRVLVVEQFRFGPWLRGDNNPWTLEPIAGRIDVGESPEAAARREAVEEANLTLTDLILVARYYPTPGAVSEYLYSFIALTDLPDSAAGIGGLASEVEDIRAHLLSFDDLMALVKTPEASNGPLILTAHALAGLRAGLRR